MNATDAADWLAKKGVPFRDAHEIIGKLVLYAIDKNASLDELSLDEWKAASDVFDETIFTAIETVGGVNARDLPGGPGKGAVLKALEQSAQWLQRSSTARD